MLKSLLKNTNVSRENDKNVSRETKLVSMVVLLTVLCGCFVSCGVSYTDEEVYAAAKELVIKSVPLNDIYFGEGLPISDDREEVERFYEMITGGAEGVNYHPVSEDCEFQSEEDIKAATEEVFSSAYCEYLYELAFTGISATFNEGTSDQRTDNASYARFIETGGVLTVRLDLPYEAMELNRTYDFSGMQIVKRKKNYVIVSVPTEKDGYSLEIELKLVLTEDGFRLDTPTY